MASYNFVTYEEDKKRKASQVAASQVKQTQADKFGFTTYAESEQGKKAAKAKAISAPVQQQPVEQPRQNLLQKAGSAIKTAATTVKDNVASLTKKPPELKPLYLSNKDIAVIGAPRKETPIYDLASGKSQASSAQLTQPLQNKVALAGAAQDKKIEDTKQKIRVSAAQKYDEQTQPDGQPSDRYGAFGAVVDTASSFRANTGNLLISGGQTAKWMGADGLGASLIKKGGEYTDDASFDSGEFDWKDLHNPRFYFSTIGGIMPFTLATLPLSFIGGSVGAGTAGAIGLGVLGKTILGTIFGSTLSGLFEAGLSAGSKHDEMLASGRSPEEANKIAQKTMAGNFTLLAITNALQFAPFMKNIVRSGVTKQVEKSLLNKAIGGATTTIGGVVSEGVEEVAQENVGLVAEGKPIDLTSKNIQGQFFGGLIGGLTFTAGGAIVDRSGKDVTKQVTEIGIAQAKQITEEIQQQIVATVPGVQEEVDKEIAKTGDTQLSVIKAVEKAIKENPDQVKQIIEDVLKPRVDQELAQKQALSTASTQAITTDVVAPARKVKIQTGEELEIYRPSTEEISDEFSIVHAGKSTFADVQKRGVKPSKNGIWGEGVYFASPNSSSIEEFGSQAPGTIYEIDKRQLNLITLDTKQSEDAFISGQGFEAAPKNLVKALQKSGEYDGAVIPNSDGTIGNTYVISNLPKLDQIIGKKSEGDVVAKEAKPTEEQKNVRKPGEKVDAVVATSKDLNNYYKAADPEKLGQAHYEVLAELEVAAPGQKIFDENGEFSSSIESTFPEWVPEELKRTDLFKSVLKGLADPIKIEYPPNSQPRKQALYDAILAEIDSRAGLDSSSIIENIKAENAKEKETVQKKEESKKAVDRSAAGSQGAAEQQVLVEEKPKEIVTTPESREKASRQPVDSPGKLKPSQAYEKVKERLEEQYQGSVFYNEMSIANDTVRAQNFIEDYPEQALRIAQGLERAPEGISDFAIPLALAEKEQAKENPDGALIAQIERITSMAGTRQGQNIVAFRGRFNEHSPHTFIQRVLKARMDIANKKSYIFKVLKREGSKASNFVAEVIDKKAAQLKKAIDKETLSKLNSAQSIIDALTC
jgi:hypothetical protein